MLLERRAVCGRPSCFPGRKGYVLWEEKKTRRAERRREPVNQGFKPRGLKGRKFLRNGF